jgi:hypothetical protein
VESEHKTRETTEVCTERLLEPTILAFPRGELGGGALAVLTSRGALRLIGARRS